MVPVAVVCHVIYLYADLVALGRFGFLLALRRLFLLIARLAILLWLLFRFLFFCFSLLLFWSCDAFLEFYFACYFVSNNFLVTCKNHFTLRLSNKLHLHSVILCRSLLQGRLWPAIHWAFLHTASQDRSHWLFYFPTFLQCSNSICRFNFVDWMNGKITLMSGFRSFEVFVKVEVLGIWFSNRPSKCKRLSFWFGELRLRLTWLGMDWPLFIEGFKWWEFVLIRLSSF